MESQRIDLVACVAAVGESTDGPICDTGLLEIVQRPLDFQTVSVRQRIGSRAERWDRGAHELRHQCASAAAHAGCAAVCVHKTLQGVAASSCRLASAAASAPGIVCRSSLAYAAEVTQPLRYEIKTDAIECFHAADRKIAKGDIARFLAALSRTSSLVALKTREYVVQCASLPIGVAQRSAIVRRSIGRTVRGPIWSSVVSVFRLQTRACAQMSLRAQPFFIYTAATWAEPVSLVAKKAVSTTSVTVAALANASGAATQRGFSSSVAVADTAAHASVNITLTAYRVARASARASAVIVESIIERLYSLMVPPKPCETDCSEAQVSNTEVGKPLLEPEETDYEENTEVGNTP